MTRLSYFGKQNSTLGSVVPLAMFRLNDLPFTVFFVSKYIFHEKFREGQYKLARVLRDSVNSFSLTKAPTLVL